METLTTLSAYHWIALGLILLTAEVLGTAGFMIGAAVAALGMGIVVWLFPDLGAGLQILLFVITALIATLVYFRIFRDAQKADNVRPLLNRRAVRLVGHQFKLERDLELGEGKVQIGDTMWTVHSEEPLAAGTLVEVVGAHQMHLDIAAK